MKLCGAQVALGMGQVPGAHPGEGLRSETVALYLKCGSRLQRRKWYVARGVDVDVDVDVERRVRLPRPAADRTALSFGRIQSTA